MSLGFKRLSGKEPAIFASLEAVTSVVPGDRIARPVSVRALIDTGILSLNDLFLMEILLLRVRMSCRLECPAPKHGRHMAVAPARC